MTKPDDKITFRCQWKDVPGKLATYSITSNPFPDRYSADTEVDVEVDLSEVEMPNGETRVSQVTVSDGDRHARWWRLKRPPITAFELESIERAVCEKYGVDYEEFIRDEQ